MPQLDDNALHTIFRKARTHNFWLDKPVSDEIMHKLYDLAKWGPTSANAGPARFIFIKSKEAKERLRQAIPPANEGATSIPDRRSRLRPRPAQW